MTEKGNHGFLQYNIYLTRGWSKEEVAICPLYKEKPASEENICQLPLVYMFQARNIMVRDERQNVDVITGLKQKTHFGRPEWTDIFKKIANDNPRSDWVK